MQMMNGVAFEVTAEDVCNVLRQAGVDRSLEECDRILATLDVAQVEHVALYGNDLEAQTVYAYNEITWQLTKAGLITMLGGTSLGH